MSPNPMAFDSFVFNIGVRPKFDAVIVYESFDLGLSAKAIYESFRRRLPESCNSSLNLWSFDTLQISKLCKAAAREAGAADMIIIAAREQREWPAGAEAWIKLWQWRQAKMEAALIGVVAQEGKSGGVDLQMIELMRGIATRSQMNFFYQTISLPGVGLEYRSWATDNMTGTHQVHR